jgi:hypothetical protein
VEVALHEGVFLEVGERLSRNGPKYRPRSVLGTDS